MSSYLNTCDFFPRIFFVSAVSAYTRSARFFRLKVDTCLSVWKMDGKEVQPIVAPVCCLDNTGAELVTVAPIWSMDFHSLYPSLITTSEIIIEPNIEVHPENTWESLNQPIAPILKEHHVSKYGKSPKEYDPHQRISPTKRHISKKSSLSHKKQYR